MYAKQKAPEIEKAVHSLLKERTAYVSGTLCDFNLSDRGFDNFHREDTDTS